MKQLILFAAFLLAAGMLDAQDTENSKIEPPVAVIENPVPDTIPSTDPNSIPKKNEAGKEKVVTKNEGKVMPGMPKYVYRLRNRLKKKKTWYDPTVDPKSLDHYVSLGWEVVRVKNMDRPSFFKQLLEWIRISLGIMRDWFGPKPMVGGQLVYPLGAGG